MTKAVQVNEAQTSLPDLLRLVAEGTEILLMEKNAPLARIVSAGSQLKPRVPGLNQGKAVMALDFDEPLPAEIWAEEA